MASLIPIEVRIINSMSDRSKDGFIGKYKWPAVPNTNEVININGYPYLVFERLWAVHPEYEYLACYLRITRTVIESDND